MRNRTEKNQLLDRQAMQTTKMVFSDVKAFLHHESENPREHDKIEIAWNNGDDIQNTLIDLGDHSGFELSVFCNSDDNYDKYAVLEILSNVGEPTANSMPASEIETMDDVDEGFNDTDLQEKLEIMSEVTERRLERLRNLLSPLLQLPIFVNLPDFDKDDIKKTADKCEELMPLIKEALRSDITLEELNKLYTDPENYREDGE